MRFGIFGKLPTKRDFIAMNLPSVFLQPWENWLQASIAASREQLGRDWQEIFLTLPIWRFWLGRGICGQSVIGAFMPSVDGVGRYFPLCICACADGAQPFTPPAVDPNHDWYGRVEEALLTALTPDFVGEPLELLDGLDPAFDAVAEEERGAETALSQLFGQGLQDILSSQSWWWTFGGSQYPVRLSRYEGLPDPHKFVDFMNRMG